jgi:hypothetical protein
MHDELTQLINRNKLNDSNRKETKLDCLIKKIQSKQNNEQELSQQQQQQEKQQQQQQSVVKASILATNKKINNNSVKFNIINQNCVHNKPKSIK